jgi:hypothetical protein
LPLGSGGERGVVVFRMVVVAGRLASTSIFPSCHCLPESSVACPERSVAIRLISENSQELGHDWLVAKASWSCQSCKIACPPAACRTARMARLQDGTTAALHARLQACQYSFRPTCTVSCLHVHMHGSSGQRHSSALNRVKYRGMSRLNCPCRLILSSIILQAGAGHMSLRYRRTVGSRYQCIIARYVVIRRRE